MTSVHHVEQVEPYRLWPGGDSRALAVLRLSPEELSERFGLVFEERYDDLDYYQRAAIRLPDHSQIWLVRYRGDPEPGTTVYADVSANGAETLRMLKKTLGLTKSDLTWVSPSVAR